MTVSILVFVTGTFAFYFNELSFFFKSIGDFYHENQWIRCLQALLCISTMHSHSHIHTTDRNTADSQQTICVPSTASIWTDFTKKYHFLSWIDQLLSFIQSKDEGEIFRIYVFWTQKNRNKRFSRHVFVSLWHTYASCPQNCCRVSGQTRKFYLTHHKFRLEPSLHFVVERENFDCIWRLSNATRSHKRMMLGRWIETPVANSQLT